jgi:hypothetical protein
MVDSNHPTNSPDEVLNTAIIFATEAHRGAFRKGTSIPYILHPLEALRAEDRRDVKILALAGKLSNIRAIHRDFRALGEAFWERFNMKDKDQIEWYYRSIMGALEDELGETLAWQEYRELVGRTFGGE